jgi:hypothetical protein
MKPGVRIQESELELRIIGSRFGVHGSEFGVPGSELGFPDTDTGTQFNNSP